LTENVTIPRHGEEKRKGESNQAGTSRYRKEGKEKTRRGATMKRDPPEGAIQSGRDPL